MVVTFVAGPVYPTFEEVRPDLEKEAADKVDQAGASIVDDFRKDLGVTVNPRYGVLKDGKLVPESGGVVDILKDDAAAAAASSSDALSPRRATEAAARPSRTLSGCPSPSSSPSVPACPVC